jgi:hypothetical protein
MARLSPTLAGFRAAFRRPALTFAEIAWRWSVGATALAMLGFAGFEYLGSLPVTGRQALMLRSRQPLLAGRALAHILGGSLPRLTLAALVGGIGLVGLWVFAAALGRLATVRGLLDYFAALLPEHVAHRDSGGSPLRPLRSLINLNLLRAAVVLASLAALQGTAILAGFASPEADPRPGLAFLIFLPLAGFISCAGLGLNWLLSLAGVFAVSDGADTMGALSAAGTLCRERSGAVAAVGTWAGLAHLTLFFMATTVASFSLALLRFASGRLILAWICIVALAYFAVADWLYMARLAGYVCISEMPDSLLAPSAVIPPMVPPQIAPPTAPTAGEAGIRTAVDQDENILSDVPNALLLYSGQPI